MANINFSQPNPIHQAWLDYIASLRSLFEVQFDELSLDQYLEFRNTVLDLAQGTQFLDDLNTGWNTLIDSTPDKPSLLEVGNTLIMELQAYSRAVEMAKNTPQEPPDPSDPPRKWWQKWFGRGSTVAGSVKDILEGLPPHAKGVLTLIKELLDLFKQ
jgi:hypothetical protein